MRYPLTSFAREKAMRARSARATVAGAVTLLWAASARAQDNGSPAAGCAACGGCGGLLLLCWLGLIALQIALLVLVARDAKARGMDSAVLWMLLVMFVPLIGLLIYLFARPQGNMIQCPNCNNKRLAASVKCPHCGAGS
jgi:uncharacterized membrane protein YhaH (DUF805 family)